MAKTGARLRLATENRSEIVDLYQGALRIRDWGWQPQVATPQQDIVQTQYGASATFMGYAPVTETFELCCFGPPDTLRDTQARLEDIVQKAVLYGNDSASRNSVWLEFNSHGEEPGRFFVLGASWQPQAAVGAWAMLQEGTVVGRLTLLRHPCRELVAYLTKDFGQLSCAGGHYAFTGVPGRLPGRIEQATVGSPAAQTFSRFWLGFRRKGTGTAGLVSTWECETADADGPHGAVVGGHGTFVGGMGMTNEDDANASLHHIARCTYADANKNHVLTIALSTVQPTASLLPDMAGEYLVLLNCKHNTGGGGSAIVQMAWGYGSTRQVFEEIPVDWTSYQFAELGAITIPPVGLVEPQDLSLATSEMYANAELWLYVQQIGASTSLDLDCIAIVPLDHFIRVNAGDTSVGTIYTTMRTQPNDRQHAYVWSMVSGAVTGIAEPQPQNWYIPDGDGILVVAADDGNAGFDAGTNVEVEIERLYPRWLLYAEGHDYAIS